MSGLHHETSARRPLAIVTLVVAWLALAAAWLWLGAAWWILLPFALLTLPALYEFLRGTVSGMDIDRSGLRWHSWRSRGEVPLDKISNVRFDTRLDLSVSMKLNLHDGRILRLPPECVPPYAKASAALDRLQIPHERHFFRWR